VHGWYSYGASGVLGAGGEATTGQTGETQSRLFGVVAENSTRLGERLCERGHWCEAGVRQLCAGGTFGSKPGLTNKRCSGWCAAGHYCPPGSVSATQRRCPDGTYSVQGQPECTMCPGTPDPSTARNMRCRTSRSCCSY
jgi:hypothetical protein